MRGPKPAAVKLSEEVRRDLELLTRRHGCPRQLALRGRIILAAAEGLNNAQIAQRERVHIDTVRHWRSRWLSLQNVDLSEMGVEDRLSDAPRSGKPPRITPEQVCQIVALAGELPRESDRPISQWSAREIANEVMARGIVDTISGRHAARLLKRGAQQRARTDTN